ncbi:MAG: hypothetical protein II817_12655 [Bacteroidales bacterium]|nr:hypothetical protein [Bacteroidales bacterium]
MAKIGCTRHSSSKLDSALACTIFASRKNIGDWFSVISRLLGSKRALYLVNTSEEFLFLNWCDRIIVILIMSPVSAFT